MNNWKVLSLTQPWATLIALGAKKIETRSWATPYRGPLLIHAAKGLGPVGGERGFRELCGTEPFCSVLNAAMRAWDTPPKSLREMTERPFMPFGAIVAVCELRGVVATEAVTRTGRVKIVTFDGEPCIWPLTDQERAFGDYSAGRYAWLLANIRALPEPIPAKGALGLWDWQGVADAAREGA